MRRIETHNDYIESISFGENGNPDFSSSRSRTPGLIIACCIAAATVILGVFLLYARPVPPTAYTVNMLNDNGFKIGTISRSADKGKLYLEADLVNTNLDTILVEGHLTRFPCEDLTKTENSEKDAFLAKTAAQNIGKLSVSKWSEYVFQYEPGQEEYGYMIIFVYSVKQKSLDCLVFKIRNDYWSAATSTVLHRIIETAGIR